MPVGIVILFVILCGEVYYLFFYSPIQNKESLNQIPTKQIKIDNLYQKRDDAEVERVVKIFAEKAKVLKPLIKSGVSKELVFTETNKTVITKIENGEVDKVMGNGKTVSFALELSFASIAESGSKNFTYLFSAGELDRIYAFKQIGEQEIPIDLDELRVGDFVSTTMSTDIYAPELETLVSFKIVKLL